MRVTLRPADDAALAALAELLCRHPVDPPGCTDHDWLLGDAAGVRDRLEQARERRAREGGRAWVVTVGDEAVGYLSARIDGEVAETFSVVAAGYQGRGIGAAARAEALRELAAGGVSRAVSVARAGGASGRISRRLGYDRIGTEVRRSPHGEEVELERWELDLRAWSRRSGAERAPQPSRNPP